MIILVEGEPKKLADFEWDCVGSDDKNRVEIWEQMVAVYEGYVK